MSARIAVFVDVFPPPFIGGAEETTLQEVESFLTLGHQVEVYALRPWLRKISDRLPRDGLTIRDFPDFPYHPSYLKKRRSRVLRTYWHLAHFVKPTHFLKILRNLTYFKPNLIYCGNITGWGITPWMISWILKVPKIQVVHDYGFICFKKTLRKSQMNKSNCGGNCIGCIPRRLLTKGLWKNGIVAFVSKRQRDLHLRAGVFNQNSKKIIQYPILLNLPKINSNERKYDYGFIGRISPEKGLDNLLTAFQLNGKTLHIAGTGDLNYIQSLKKISPASKFYGYMDRWEFLKNVKVLIVPSIWEEPAGRIVREGIGAGCNLAVSKFGGLNEMGDFPGVRMLTFDPFDLDSISKIFANPLNWNGNSVPSDFEKFLSGDAQTLMNEICAILNVDK